MDYVRAEPSAVDQASEHRARMLVVDDDQSIQVLLTRMLSLGHYDVACAANGRQAVEMIQEDRFDLIITDVVMPGDLNGIDVLRMAREVDPHYPVIVITGYLDTEDTARAIELGADDFIPKPFNASLILSAVAVSLARRQSS